jgi:TonB family protein
LTRTLSGYNLLPDVGSIKIMAKRLLVLSVFLLAPFALSCQPRPLDLKFGGHTLGEPADVFFSTARVSDSNQLTKDYCKALLDDAKTKEQMRQYEEVQKDGGVFALGKKDFSFLDVGNCKQAMAALEGKQASVGARLAAEIGKGSALFASGRLSVVTLTVDSSYADTVSDMERRFGVPGKKDTVSRTGWPPVQEMRWERDGVGAAVWKVPFSDQIVALVGFLAPPYDSFLLGTPAPESGVFSPETCKATTQSDSKKAHLSPGETTGQLYHRVPPVYPEAARRSGIEGVVTLAVTIDECGNVVDPKPISGPQELVSAAITAVKQWKFRPYMYSGQPTAVDAELHVRFALSQ